MSWRPYVAQAFQPARDGLESPSYTLPYANGTKCRVARQKNSLGGVLQF